MKSSRQDAKQKTPKKPPAAQPAKAKKSPQKQQQQLSVDEEADGVGGEWVRVGPSGRTQPGAQAEPIPASGKPQRTRGKAAVAALAEPHKGSSKASRDGQTPRQQETTPRRGGGAAKAAVEANVPSSIARPVKPAGGAAAANKALTAVAQRTPQQANGTARQPWASPAPAAQDDASLPAAAADRAADPVTPSPPARPAAPAWNRAAAQDPIISAPKPRQQPPSQSPARAMPALPPPQLPPPASLSPLQSPVSGPGTWPGLFPRAEGGTVDWRHAAGEASASALSDLLPQPHATHSWNSPPPFQPLHVFPNRPASLDSETQHRPPNGCSSSPVPARLDFGNRVNTQHIILRTDNECRIG